MSSPVYSQLRTGLTKNGGVQRGPRRRSDMSHTAYVKLLTAEGVRLHAGGLFASCVRV